MSKMFDYLVHGGDKVAELEAALEHMGGALSREIEEGAKERAEVERLRAENADMVRMLRNIIGDDEYLRVLALEEAMHHPAIKDLQTEPK